MTPDRLLITGGFNVHVDMPNDPTAAKFLSILESFGLVQHVAVPTHVAGHTLDLVITREDCDLLTCSPVVHYMISSHSTVLFPLSMAKPSRPTIVRTCRAEKRFLAFQNKDSFWYLSSIFCKQTLLVAMNKTSNKGNILRRRTGDIKPCSLGEVLF